MSSKPDVPPQALPDPVAASRHPLTLSHFRNLWLGATISFLGDQFYLVALPWLALQLTGSSLALGSILMIAGIPRAAFMLVGGANWSLPALFVGAGAFLVIASALALTQPAARAID